MFSTSVLEAIAKDTISLLKKDFTFSDHSFFLEKNKDTVFNAHIYPDIGDYLPFFLFFGEQDFIDLHIAQLRNALKKGILVSEHKTFGLSHLAKSYEYSDYLLGLLDYYEMTQTETAKDFLFQNVATAIQLFKLDSKKLCSFRYTPLNIAIPIIDTRDGMFIEIFVDLYKTFNDKQYLEIANSVARQLMNNAHMQTRGYLPDFIAHGWGIVLKCITPKKFSNVTFCKNNTNTLYGLLSLYSVTKDKKIICTIEKMVDTLLDAEINLVPKYKDREDCPAFLTSSFAFIDFLCDVYTETKNIKFIEQAERIALFWLHQQGATGLFPHFSDINETFLDSETDMIVALYKVFEVTQKSIYKDAADRCFQGLLTYHQQHGFPLGVNIHTGVICNPIQRTKFIALFLKTIILYISYSEGKTIYGNVFLYNILRDR